MKLFGTDGIRGTANRYPITPEMALRLGKAAALVFSKGRKRPKILIGKDTRISGYILESALTSGICSMGADALLVGPMPTPAISFLTVNAKAAAGIVISASHNPAEDNGIKFFSSKGGKLPENVEQEIEHLALQDSLESTVSARDLGKAYRLDDARLHYISLAKSSIKIRLSGLRIVIDCANGAAYSVAPAVLKQLGATVIPINNSPDGLNINLNCGALHPEAMRKAVKKYKADAGIALDGDADRVIMADEKGRILDGDDILALCALRMKQENKLRKNMVVATVMTNLGIEESLWNQGITMLRTKVGDKYVAEQLHLKKLSLGGEQAGHIIMPGINPTGDGLIAALQVLGIMKSSRKPLSMLAQFQKYPQILVNVKVREKKDFESIPKVYNSIRQAQQALGSSGRVLVRYSGTENLARVMVEGKDKLQIKRAAESIAGEIKAALGV
ncbi:phosphoglucosamine mutase [Candidatus Woesearchaeota archaeon]|nr:phosphoglucosamine mutase [Candidatus Woesearchaeota archaeon]